MTRSTSLPRRLAALLGAAAIIAACSGTTPSASVAPSSEAPASVEPSASQEPFEAMVYPTDGDAPCGVEPYTGTIKKISATDRLTVTFDLCAPDPAFLPKVAFSVFGIHDADYLEAHAADKSYLDNPNGTGPYKLGSWEKGNRIVLNAFDGYWGEKAKTPNVEFRWSDEAAQRLLELQSGNVDGIDNPGADDIATIQGDSALKFNPREGMNTFYLGFNNTIEPWTDENVRKGIALGINREELVENFYPEGSEVATHFTPCSVPHGCEGDAWYDFDAAEGKRLLEAANFDFSKTYKLQFRAAVRGYLPDPPVIATQIQQQLKNNLGINSTLDLQESGAFLDANAAGTLDGIFLLGWGADYPDPTNFLDYHFGSGSGAKFGKPFDDVVAALNKGATSLDDATRKEAYTEANNLIKQHVPAVIVAHGASGTAFKADVEGSHSSPLSTEIFAVMKAAERDTLVWMQNAEPLSLYCGDETDGESLRACEQVTE
ncbi:MAG TPA: ABC transporter substrate-binding protein, partial [Candidatus Limnocylindrales bacterium]|nr:ABC transporter substrate-binding protein [Candidatus Limnocylindrales bacterium]